jgi:hypothetical protein
MVITVKGRWATLNLLIGEYGTKKDRKKWQIAIS